MFREHPDADPDRYRGRSGSLLVGQGQWIAGGGRLDRALVLHLDLDPRTVRRRMPDLLEGSGHRPAGPPAAITGGEPGQPAHDPAEDHDDSDGRQQIVHASSVGPTDETSKGSGTEQGLALGHGADGLPNGGRRFEVGNAEIGGRRLEVGQELVAGGLIVGIELQGLLSVVGEDRSTLLHVRLQLLGDLIPALEVGGGSAANFAPVSVRAVPMLVICSLSCCTEVIVDAPLCSSPRGAIPVQKVSNQVAVCSSNSVVSPPMVIADELGADVLVADKLDAAAVEEVGLEDAALVAAAVELPAVSLDELQAANRTVAATMPATIDARFMAEISNGLPSSGHPNVLLPVQIHRST